MKRSRLLYIPPLLLALLTLAACLRSNPAYPTPFPTIAYDLTSIAQTMVAVPSSTVTTTLTSNPQTKETIPADLNPQTFMYFYFGNINARNYTLTWSLLTSRFQNKSGGYQAYLNFWNSVKQVVVKGAYYTCQSNLCIVNAILQIEYNNGKVTNDTYPYTLTRDYTRNTWMFDIIPTPTNAPSRTRTPTATPTRSATPTRTITRTLTPTSTATGSGTPTPSQTPTGSATATPTGTLTVTQTLTGTSTLTPTWTLTPTVSPTASPTASGTETYTPTATASETQTWTQTETPTATATGP
ncbi:MAG TPA: hypothetical protein VII93_04805 [Anaerolineales bacterium]